MCEWQAQYWWRLAVHSLASRAQGSAARTIGESRRAAHRVGARRRLDGGPTHRISPADRARRAMIAGEMRAIGLRPMGDSGYYQRVPVSATDSAITLRKRAFGRRARSITRPRTTCRLASGQRSEARGRGHRRRRALRSPRRWATGERRFHLQRRRRRCVRNGVCARGRARARARHASEALDPVRAHHRRRRGAARHQLAARALPGAA